MTLATALITGNEAHPHLAEEAVREALGKAGLARANSVLMFLTPDFARQAQATVTAAARAAQCLQIGGGIASGVLTESGWALDRPAAALMVFGEALALGMPTDGESATLSYAGGTFPGDWNGGLRRIGGMFSGVFAGSTAHTHPAVWQNSRLADPAQLSYGVRGADLAIGVSTGVQALGPALRIAQSNSYDLQRVGDQSAARSLADALPAAPGELSDAPLHACVAIVVDDAPATDRHLVPIIAANADESLTLAEPLAAGQQIIWGIRCTAGAEADMRACVDRLAGVCPSPEGALLFSCIGRGPFFYAGEDRDLDALRLRFPGLPILGAYGTGQIAPLEHPLGHTLNRQFENTVVTALMRRKSSGESPCSSPQ